MELGSHETWDQETMLISSELEYILHKKFNSK